MGLMTILGMMYGTSGSLSCPALPPLTPAPCHSGARLNLHRAPWKSDVRGGHFGTGFQGTFSSLLANNRKRGTGDMKRMELFTLFALIRHLGRSCFIEL